MTGIVDGTPQPIFATRQDPNPGLMILSAIAGIGLVLSLAVHVAALAGIALFGRTAFFLHGGIFVVWFPTVIVANREAGNYRRADFWKVALRACPPWMKKLCIGFFVYAFLNFAYFLIRMASIPSTGGSEPPDAVTLRGFSGHWMAFYSAAMAVLYSSAHTWGRAGKRFTPDGMWRLAKEGLLGPDHNVAHGNALEDDELKVILDAGCSVSATCLAEMFNSERVALLGRLRNYGAMPSLGSDCDPYFNGSMFWVMRHAFQHQREIDSRLLHAQGAWPPERSQHATQTRHALEWATMGGAKMMRMEHKIGSLTPGKQADIVLIDGNSMNIFPAVPAGDPIHAVVMHAEAGDVDTVLIAGKPVKRGGRLLFPERRLTELRTRLLASRERIMREGNYQYRPAEPGPLP